MKISTITVLPERLARLHDPPEQLFTAGVPLRELLACPALAVVGSRAASVYGTQVTQQLVTKAARAGIVIISGLALGIDSIAHQAALDAAGTTVAVLPASLERIYPASHQQLAQQIVNGGGTLISEYSGTARPMKYQFIARNRLIAGLADAVLITEAAERSGSLHTAQFALEAGKDVFAVPGNITSPGSAGVNNLIKAGATPVTNPSDILHAFSIKRTPVAKTTFGSPIEQQLHDLIRQGVTSVELLVKQSGLPVHQCQQALTMLEISGHIEIRGANLLAID